MNYGNGGLSHRGSFFWAHFSWPENCRTGRGELYNIQVHGCRAPSLRRTALCSALTHPLVAVPLVPSDPIAKPEVWQTIPAAIREQLADQLRPGETPLCWFEPDLDRNLHYRCGLVVLTNQRLLSWEPPDGAASSRPLEDRIAAASSAWESGWRCWPLEPGVTLRVREYAGAGVLEWVSPSERLACWRYSLARAVGARRLAAALEALREGRAVDVSDSAPPGGAECASCGATLQAHQVACPRCGAMRPKPPVKSLWRLHRFARKRFGAILLGFCLTLVATAASLIPPYLTMPLMDEVLIPYEYGQRDDLSPVKWYLLGLAGAATLAFLLGWARTYVLAWVSERIAADLRQETYNHLQRLSLEFFGSKRTGDLISRISNDTDRICYFLSVHLLDFANDLLMITMTAGVMLWISPWLALVTLCPLPFIVILIHRVRDRLKHGFQFASRAWAEMTSVLADTIPGIRVVKAFAQEKKEIDRFRRANQRVLTANDRVNFAWSLFDPVMILLTDLGVLVIWGFAVYQIWQRNITVGVLAAFLQYIGRFYARLDSMSRIVTAAQRAGAATQRVFAILDRKSTVPEPTRPVRPGRLRGAIEFRNVSFRYGSRTVLSNVNLKIEPGEMIGLVGPSGAGKTTMINLICRFFDVAEGAILVDDIDIRSFPVEEYRRNIGIVLQEPFLFYGTIAENIAYGKPDATQQQIIAAARAARAHEFILRLPEAYDSLVGERGQLLSGGERQRISIARALLIDPRILILDEATSSVDTETEHEIQLALENLIKGRTTIAIAHRLSTLRRADRLVVIERGRLVEVGSHRELLGRSGTYARLYHAQYESAGSQHTPAAT